MKVTPGRACQQDGWSVAPGQGGGSHSGTSGLHAVRVHQEKPRERRLIYVIVKPHFAGMFCNMESLANYTVSLFRKVLL